MMLVLSSFLIETIFRIKTAVNAIPRGYRLGILRSFIIYFRIPFRYRKMKKFYGNFLEPDDLAFDVGAHIGNRTRVFSELCSEVVCFEPQPSCRGLLEMWFSANSKIHLNYSALGTGNKEVIMYMSRKNPTLASIDPEWVSSMQSRPEFRGVEWDESCITQVKTIDSMIEKYGKPKLIKIDTEGTEGEILSALNYPAEVISFELLPGEKNRAIECMNRISAIGRYKFNYSIGESMRMCLTKEIYREEMRKFIESYPEKGRSGDIYAILEDTL